MLVLFFVSLGLQGLLMAVDELYFHRRRELPSWERWGHPVDTFFFALALFVLWRTGPGPASVTLSILSTVLITKDEWVHANLCVPGEHWIHALLFCAHPVVLILAHLSWGQWGGEVLTVLAMFLAYQILYWNFYVDRALAKRP